jgi:hypothetical protein
MGPILVLSPGDHHHTFALVTTPDWYNDQHTTLAKGWAALQWTCSLCADRSDPATAAQPESAGRFLAVIGRA